MVIVVNAVVLGVVVSRGCVWGGVGAVVTAVDPVGVWVVLTCVGAGESVCSVWLVGGACGAMSSKSSG